MSNVVEIEKYGGYGLGIVERGDTIFYPCPDLTIAQLGRKLLAALRFSFQSGFPYVRA